VANADKARVVGTGVERALDFCSAFERHSTHDACDPVMGAGVAEEGFVFCECVCRFNHRGVVDPSRLELWC